MRLNRTSWHYKVYAWWYHHKRYGEFDSANLCPYVRTVLFYAPLRFLFCWGCPVCTYVALILGIPLTLQYLGYLELALEFWSLYAFLLTIAVLLGVFAFILVSISYLLDKHNERRNKTEPDPNSTWNMTKAYCKALHNKVCPFIEFKD